MKESLSGFVDSESAFLGASRLGKYGDEDDEGRVAVFPVKSTKSLYSSAGDSLVGRSTRWLRYSSIREDEAPDPSGTAI